MHLVLRRSPVAKLADALSPGGGLAEDGIEDKEEGGHEQRLDRSSVEGFASNDRGRDEDGRDHRCGRQVVQTVEVVPGGQESDDRAERDEAGQGETYVDRDLLDGRGAYSQRSRKRPNTRLVANDIAASTRAMSK